MISYDIFPTPVIIYRFCRENIMQRALPKTLNSFGFKQLFLAPIEKMSNVIQRPGKELV